MLYLLLYNRPGNGLSNLSAPFDHKNSHNVETIEEISFLKVKPVTCVCHIFHPGICAY